LGKTPPLTREIPMKTALLKLVSDESPVPVLGKKRKSPPRRRPNSEYRQREYLTTDEMAKILKAVRKNRYGIRDYCLVLLMARHGLRVSEAITLKVENIDFGTSSLYVKRLKGSKSSSHPLSGVEMRAIRTLLKKMPSTTWLFLSNRAAPMTRGNVQAIFAKAGKDAGIPFRVHPHQARHFTGWALCNRPNPVDLRTLQSWMGHANPSHTIRYSELAPGRFRGIWDD
jgi:integrase